MSELLNRSAQVAAGALVGLAGSQLQAEMSELASKLTDSDIEAARAARRTMWQQVRRAGRPGAEEERQRVEAELITLVRIEQPAAVYREVLWMLSEIGTGACVNALAALLANETVREDARMSLERIPGDESLAALQSALASVPEDFKINIAQSLRARGITVPGLPCEKLKPVKQTRVAPASQ